MFAGLTGLGHLDLGSNRLTTLPDEVFDELTALKVLSLDFNNLATLDAGVFDELTALTDLDLAINQLTTLPDDVFQPLTALTGLTLRGNPGAPFAPEAVALPDDGTVSAAGGMVTLDGSGSDGGPWGTNVTYGWALTDPVSGVTVTFDDDTSATPVVTIPALAEGTGRTFTLTVTGRGGTDGIVPATDTATVTAISDDATLSALTVNDGTNDLTLAPPFASGTFAYAADVAHAVDEVTLSATVNHAGASVSAVTLNGTAVADGDFTDGITVSGLLVDGNEIVVTVTAQDTSTTRTYTVTVTRAANAAPTALAASVTTDEDTAYTFAAADFNFTDTDSGDALASVTVVTLPAEGALTLDGTPVMEDQSVPAADIGKLVFTPAANGNGDAYASFTFRVHDGTDESASSYVMTVNVTAMNDPATGAPTISGTARVGETLTAATISGTARVGETLTAATAGIADVDGLTSPTYGYQWIRVDADGTSNPTDITGATLATYTPVRADVGRKVRVKVSFTDDDSNDEERTSAPTATVLANTAPTALDASVTTNEDTAYTFAAADFNFTDSDGHALASVTVVTLPTEGSLTLDGPAVTAGQSVPAADIGKLVFTPAPNAHGDAHARFTFRVHDGTDESAAAYTMTVNVTAMNDPATGAPTISGTAVVGQTLTAATLGIADVDGLTSPSYGYQWVRVDDDGTSNPTDITGATSATYKQVEADVGRKLRVTVSFTDDDGNDEELTSAPTATETVLDPTVGICGRTPQVRDALVALIPVVSNCADVTATHLAAITGTLELSGQQIIALAVGDFAVGDFAGLTSLTRLSLYSNALTTLPTGVFAELTALTELLLGSNQLSTLPDGVFDGLTRLETLALHNNALTMLDDGVFDGLTALRSLNLHGTKLAMLSDDVFKPLTALAELLLGGNRLTTLPAEVFNGLTSLTVLRLARNELTTLDAGVFDGLTSLTQLYLNNNELTTLDDDVFEPLTALIALTLRGNPGAPFAPEAVALPDDGTVPTAGGMVTLDGSGSDGGPWGTNVTYGWALTDPVSGVTVTFDDATSATPEVTIPALAAGTGLTFTLTVTGRGGTDGIVPATDTATVTVTASNDAKLSALTVNDGTSDLTLAPAFVSGTFVYAADVATAVDEVTLSATVNHAGASVSAVTLNGTAVADSDFTDGITVSALLAGGNDIVVTVTAQDTSTTRTYTVTVTANTAPTALDALVTTNEDTAYTFGAADFNFDDTDTGDALASVTVVTLPTEGSLTLDGPAVTTGQLVPAADIGKLVFTPVANGNGAGYASFTFRVHDGTDESASAYTMTVNVTAMNDPATGAPTISGAARVGQVLTADASGIADIDGLPAVSAFAYRWIRVEGGSDTEIPAATSGTYRLVAGDVDKKLKVRVSFTDLDGHAEALTSAAYPAGTQVSANTAPTASDETVTVEEDSSYRFQASDFGFADTDGDALGSVKITALPLAGTGTLELDATAVTTGQSVPAADIGKLVFTPAANGNGDAYASFTFRVHDGTDESAASYVMTVNVTAMNDPATGAPTISGAARVGQVLTADASGIADIDGLPAVSAFAYRWIRVEGGSDTEIPAATSGTYRLVAGDVDKKLKVRVSFTDLDGHAEALTSAAYPAGTQVSANTAPTASDETVTVEEDSSYRFQASDFGFADTDGDALGSVKITALPLAGTLGLDGTTVMAGQSVPAADIGKLVFTPAANGNGDAYGFTFRVHDGTDESAASYVMTVNVTAMNDPATGAPTISGAARVGQVLTADASGIADIDGLPAVSAFAYRWIRVEGGSDTEIPAATSGTYRLVAGDVDKKLKVRVSFTDLDGHAEALTSAAYPAGTQVSANTAPTASDETVTVEEDSSYRFQASDFGFADTDGDALGSVKITALPLAGTLGLDGTTVMAGQSVPAADIGKLVFTPAANGNGDAYASFTFRVHDGTDESAASYVMTVNVTAMNDPATGAPTISGTAQVGQTLTAATTGIADVDGLPSSFTYQWIRVDADGTSNPTDITGATLATYTPVRADVGNKLRVKVSFTDDDSNDEELTSDAYPASGTVEAAPNAAPSFTSSATYDAAENQLAVGMVAAADSDPGDSVTGYALQGGADRSQFSIVEATGELTFDAAPNFEAAADADTDNDYVVVVRATSGTGERLKTADQTITVTVTDEDGEAPGAPATPTVSSASVSSVTVAWAAPSNAGPPITDYDYRYRVKAPQGPWTEVTTTPIPALGATITGLAENTEYEVQVRATNAEGTGGWSDPPGSGATDANAAPSFMSLATFDVVENQLAVGMVAAADGDPGDSVTGYAIQGGADQSRFTIVPATGELAFTSAPNFEAAADADTDNDYVVVVRASSGTGERLKTADQTITVTVTDEAGEAPGVPATPAVSSASVSSVTVTWAAPSNAGPPITDYDYRYRVKAPQGPWTEVTTTPIPALGATITGLAENTEYEVQVRATNAEGTGGWSDPPGSGATDANAAPSFMSLATFDVVENQLAVGMVAAADGDPGDSVTGYAIQGGADQSRFTIVPATGELAFTSAPNFEAAADADTDNDYVVVVRASSGTGERLKTADQTITVTVTDEAGEAPGVPATPTVSSASVSSVTVAWAAPSNAGPPIADYDYRYRVKTPQGSWTEVTTTPITALGATITGLAENTEYEVQVRATNAEGTGGWSDPPGSGSTDANAAPSFTTPATFDAAENQLAVGTVAAADGDPGDSVTGYAIQGGADQSRFTIVPATGVLTFGSAPNFEAAADADTNNDYVVVVRATSGAGEREKTADQTITVTVTDEAGEAPGAPATPTVSSASVSSVTVTWAAPSNAGPPIADYDYRYRVKTPQGSWTEVTNTPITALGVTIAGLAENTEYEVQVRATNAEGTGDWSDPPGSGSTDANAAPSFTTPATYDAAENQTVVGTVAASDSDPGDSVTGYAIQGGADQSRFTIVEATGVLAFTSAPNFEAAADADTDNDYVVVVRATSGTGAREKTADQTITVRVTDEAGEAPGAPATPSVATASVSSVTVTWAAPSNAGPPIADYDYRYRVKTPQGSWTEVTNTPITALGATIAGLAENTEYEVQVRATNAEGTGGWSDPPGSGATDANAAPSFTTPATYDAAENQTVVGTVAASDSDPGDSVTGYAIRGGADRSKFSIIEATGVLTFASAPNFEAAADADTNNDYVVVVRATSGTGEREKTADQTITVTVTDEAGEAPGAPATPSVSSASVSSVTVTWAAPSNAGPAIADYDYRYRVKTPQGSWTEVTSTPIPGLSATIAGLAENTEYEVQVRATNAEGTGGWSDPPGSGATDANAAPSFTTPATFDAAENQLAVGTAQASDSDGGDSVTGYAIRGGADAAQFTIVPATGVLTFVSAPNFEAAADADTDNDYVVVVRATSGTGERVKTADQTITVRVTDVDGEAPGAPATPSVSSASVSSVTVAWAAPANAGPPIADYDYRYRVKTPQGSWTEVTNTPITALGATIAGLAEDTEYEVQVRATNAEGTGGWSDPPGSGSTDANAAPSFTTPATFDAAENQTVVGTVAAADGDPGDSVTGYAIQGGADASQFTIVEATGVLAFASAPNFEAAADADTDNDYVVVVRATSGTGERLKTADQTITVRVTDEAGEAPGAPATPSVSSASVSSVTVAWAAPSNAGPPIADYDYRYRVKTPQGSWTEVTNTPITALGATIAGLAENTEYEVQVRATNAEGTGGWSDPPGSGSTDANAAPSFTTPATFDAAENQTVVGTVAASDGDPGDSVTGYAIQGGADAAQFTIVEATGVLTFDAAPNFEAAADADADNDYVVVVRATSGTGVREKTADQTITVTVTDEAEVTARRRAPRPRRRCRRPR